MEGDLRAINMELKSFSPLLSSYVAPHFLFRTKEFLGPFTLDCSYILWLNSILKEAWWRRASNMKVEKNDLLLSSSFVASCVSSFYFELQSFLIHSHWIASKIVAYLHWTFTWRRDKEKAWEQATRRWRRLMTSCFPPLLFYSSACLSRF